MQDVLAGHTWLLLVVAVVVLLGTGVFIPLARHQGWVAAVSARSSHRLPTPTGAGIVLALVLVVVFAALQQAGQLPVGGRGFVAGVIALAILGWLDDRHGLPVWLRLLVQWAVVLVFAWCSLSARGLLEGVSGWLLLLLGVVAHCWFINLFNFMDGLDGFAASEAVFIALSGMALGVFAPGWGVLEVLAAAGVLGLLVWNFPPARVFMGDAGSLVLGFVLSAPLWWGSGTGLVTWLTLAAAFVVDASLTLAWRWRQGERIASAHRQHAYQHLARQWDGHRPVLGLLLAINMLWLLPWAWFGREKPALAGFGLLVSALGLGLVWAWYRRGLAARLPGDGN